MKTTKQVTEQGVHYSPCGGGRCPSFHITDDDNVIIMGSMVSEDDKRLLYVPADEDVVKIPLDTFNTLVNHYKND